MDLTPDNKPQVTHEENYKDQHVVLRSEADNIRPWRAMLLYKRVVAVLMLAAFSASLDGYQSGSRWCWKLP